jgi:hypothetical protein
VAVIDWIYESDAVETFCWAEIDRTDIMIVRTDDMRWAWRLESSKDRLTPRGECATLEKAKSNALAALTRWQNREALTRWQERTDIVRELEVFLQALKEENAMLRDTNRELRDARTLDNDEAARLYDFARNKGEALERQAVVAWLRDNRSASTLPKGCWEADAIERGEHRREEGA